MGYICKPSPSQDSNDFSSSHFERTVSLFDWWLIRAEGDFHGNTLAVAGCTNRKQKVQQPRRIFKSAPISRIHDFCTLETADGIYVVIMGLINKSETTENGFPSEVFNHFLFGFPPNWEDYASKNFGEVARIDLKLESSSPKQTSSRELFGEGASIDLKSESSSPEQTSIGELFGEGASIDLKSESSSPEQASSGELFGEGASIDLKSESSSPEQTSTGDVEVMAETCHTPNIVDQQRSSPSQRGGKGRRVVKENRLPKRRRSIKEHRLPKEKIVERTPIVDQQTSTSDHAGGGRREVKRNSLPGEKTGERTPTGLQGISFTSRDSFRRSRSGRVLLPPLEFWRNQVPIYDAERKIAGIQEGIDLITEPGGAGKSYVRKRQAKR